MKLTTVLFLPVQLAIAAGPCSDGGKKFVRFGYFQSNSASVSDLNADDYTHLCFSSAKIGPDLLVSHRSPSDVEEYQFFNALKSSNPGLRTSISIGGWAHNNEGEMQSRFGEVAGSPETRVAFADSVVAFLRKYGFDGVDLDWEYPVASHRGGTSADYSNYKLLVAALRAAIDAAPEEFELTVAVPLGYDSQYFDVSGMEKYLDWFNVLSYDIREASDSPKVVATHADRSDIDSFLGMYFPDVSGDKLVLDLAAFSFDAADTGVSEERVVFDEKCMRGVLVSVGDPNPNATLGSVCAIRYTKTSCRRATCCMWVRIPGAASPNCYPKPGCNSTSVGSNVV